MVDYILQVATRLMKKRCVWRANDYKSWIWRNELLSVLRLVNLLWNLTGTTSWSKVPCKIALLCTSVCSHLSPYPVENFLYILIRKRRGSEIVGELIWKIDLWKKKPMAAHWDATRAPFHRQPYGSPSAASNYHRWGSECQLLKSGTEADGIWWKIAGQIRFCWHQAR